MLGILFLFDSILVFFIRRKSGILREKGGKRGEWKINKYKNKCINKQKEQTHRLQEIGLENKEEGMICCVVNNGVRVKGRGEGEEEEERVE